MASCTKVAAFAAMLRVCQVALAPMEWTWQPVLGVIAGASMVIGAVIGITQTDMKRMLAYSSVAHAGFILLGVLAMSERGASATMFYLLTYGMATIGAFAILTVVRKGDGEASHVSDWAGLAKRSPVLAASMSLFLLSFAGIPLTAGFIGKLSVFTAAMESGMGALVVLAMVATAVTAFFYLRIVVVMYFAEPVTGTGPAQVPVPVSAAAGEAGGSADPSRRRRPPRRAASRHRCALRRGARSADRHRHRGRGHRHSRSRPVPRTGARLADRSAADAVMTTHFCHSEEPRRARFTCCVPHRRDRAGTDLT